VCVFSIVIVGVSAFEVEYDCVRVAVDESGIEKVGVAERVSVDTDEGERDEVAEKENTSVALKLELLVLEEFLVSVAELLSVKDDDKLTADDAV
jgi:hypothetical protein